MQDNSLATQKPIQRDYPLGSDDEIDLLELASIMLSHWWKMAVCTLLFAILAFGYANYRYVPRYSATAKLYINNSNVSIGISQVSINSADLFASQALVDIYREFLDSHLVLDASGKALEDQGIPGYSYANLRRQVSAAAAGNTQMMYITAWDNNPENAIYITNTVVKTLPSLAENIIEGSSVVAIDPAYSAVLLPSSIRRTTMIGAAAGFVFSAAMVLLYYYFLNDVIQKQEWMESAYPGLPSLGNVPDTLVSDNSGYGYYGYGHDTRKKKRQKTTDAGFGPDLNFFGTEAYNTLRTNVKFSFPGKSTGHVIGISSAMPSEGKSYTAVNLAYAMAKDNLKVLLIDGDMRKQSLNKYLSDKIIEVGLSEVLSGQALVKEQIQDHPIHENLFVLFSGETPPNPSELLGSETMEKMVCQLRQEYDYILVDLPPVGSVTDAAAVSAFLDGLIVVVRNGYSRKRNVRFAIRQLELTGVRLLGFVFNAEVERSSLYGSRYSRYYRKYSKEYGRKKEKEKS